ncbi:MAG: hypothetical protein AB8E15_05455 [Bdellovibrionales bacterium]
MKILFCLLGLSLALSAQAKKEEVKNYSFISSSIDELDLSNENGRVKVETHSSDSFDIKITNRSKTNDCTIKVEDGTTELSVDVDSKGLGNEDCDVDIEVKVPERKISYDIEVANGVINVSGVEGDVETSLANGSADINGKAIYDFESKSANGTVVAKGLVGDASVKAANGMIQLNFKEVAKKAKINVKTANGDAKVFVPKASKFKTKFISMSGDLVNEIGDDPESEAKIKMFSANGSLTISPY